MASTEMPPLVRVWEEQAERLRSSSTFEKYMEQMRRQIAIETGIIERLYTIDRGITQLLIEEGIDEALIPHGSTDRPASEIVAMVRDHEQAIEQLFIFVNQQRSLSASFIKQIHQLLTAHQDYVDAVDQFGQFGQVTHERGVYKRWPNNPKRPDGEIHEYAPPEQVASEMDRLIKMHLNHVQINVPAEVESAWLHHRFTQIHPFQDGNGRVARCLASLIFIRAKWFPLVITRDDRISYIEALEEADSGDLKSLIALFTKAQRRAFVRSLSLSEQVLSEEHLVVSGVISSIADKLRERTILATQEAQRQSENYAESLFELTASRFHDLETEIRTRLGISINIRYSNAFNNDIPRRTYNRYQVAEAAKKLEYYANYRDYHSWVLLRFQETPEDTSHFEILASIHALGREYLGVLACSVCGYWKDSVDGGNDKIIREVKPLVELPFQFSYADDETSLQSRFRTWLEDALVAGLEMWRKNL